MVAAHHTAACPGRPDSPQTRVSLPCAWALGATAAVLLGMSAAAPGVAAAAPVGDQAASPSLEALVSGPQRSPATGPATPIGTLSKTCASSG